MRHAARRSASALVRRAGQSQRRTLVRQAARRHRQGRQQQRSWWARNGAAFGAAAGAFAAATAATATVVLADDAGSSSGSGSAASSSAKQPDYDAIREEVRQLLDSNPDYDDGSYGPVLVRLAWHACGTYDKESGTGGSDGATMRFPPESDHGANAGLHVARALLEPIKARHPEISYSDLWQLAGATAIEAMGGPKIDWRPGRTDKGAELCTPDGRLPDGALGQDHLRQVFYRMGFNDQEIVALSGAHVLGRCHRDRSGFDGPWSSAPTRFTNEYFVLLNDFDWHERKWDGPRQFQDDSETLMMLPTDMALVRDPAFKKWVDVYAEDQDAFFRDFAYAFKKLQELGVKPFRPWWEQIW